MAESHDADALSRRRADMSGVGRVDGKPVDADELTLPVVGRSVSVVALAASNSYLRLHFWGTPDYVIEVEGASSVRPFQGASVDIEPQAGPYDSVLQLLGQDVVEAVATHAGRLRLRFVDGSEFEVEEPAGYETWQLRDDDGAYMIVTNAGGGVVEFGTITLQSE